jgi:hypothetical protein
MMGAVRVAVFLAIGVPLAVSRAADADGSPASAPSPAPSPPAKRLKLGPYLEPYGRVPVDGILDGPRFETRVEVEGKAMDSAALTARMEWWMRDFEPIRGAVPNGGSAPSLQEIHEYRPHVTEGANLLPVLDWLLGKITKKP